MISSNLILMAEETGTGIKEHLPFILFLVAGVLVALAFVSGFIKGFRKVSWNGLAWIFGGLCFYAAGKLIPLVSGDAKRDFWVTLFIAAVCAGGAFALFKVLAYALRPKIRWIDDDVDGDTSLAEYGLEFEPEYRDYDGEHDANPYGKRIYKTGYDTPGIVARLLGGISSAVNVGVAFGMVFCVFLLTMDVNWLNTGKGATRFMEFALWLTPYAKNYFFDFLMIGIMMLMANVGFKKGIVNNLRAVLILIAIFVAMGFSFYLPFSAHAADGILGTLVTVCKNLVSDWELLGFNAFVGQILASLVLLTFSLIAIFIVNILLKGICEKIESLEFTGQMDSWLAAIVYLGMGVVICIGMWFVLGTIDILGVYPVFEMLGQRAFLARNTYEYIYTVIAPYLLSLNA